MKLLIDDANLEKIAKLWDYYPMDGVTTNPSILAKSGENPYKILSKIREIIGSGAELHVQVISEKAEDMTREAHSILKKLGKNTYIKIPVIEEGLKAIKLLSAEGVLVTATAVYSPLQATLAAKAGAKYAAPYVNRIDNLGENGIAATKTIHDIFKKNAFETEVLAASFKNSQQVLELWKYGVGALTVGSDVIEGLLKNLTVGAAVKDFISDFETLCGSGKTMLDC